MNRSQALRNISRFNQNSTQIWGTRVRLILVVLGIVFTWAAAVPARADDGPRIVKTRLHDKLWQNHSYWPPKATAEQYDATSWLPDIQEPRGLRGKDAVRWRAVPRDKIQHRSRWEACGQRHCHGQQDQLDGYSGSGKSARHGRWPVAADGLEDRSFLREPSSGIYGALAGKCEVILRVV